MGLCVDPDRVRDKDGISAAVVAADLVTTLQATGHTLLDRLDELALAHGLVVTGQLSIRVADLTQITGAMARLRASPPTMLLGEPVTEAADLLPRTDAVRLRTARVRVVVRPSGTEPKLKGYLQLTTAVPADAGPADLAGLRAAAAAQLAALTNEVDGVLGVSD